MGVKHATTADLRDIVDAFGAVAWPAPRDVISPIADRLGWKVHLDRDPEADLV